MNGENVIGPVLAAYPPQYQPRDVEDLGAAGGFSGARFWRLATPAGVLCLRRWPADHPSPERLSYIHAVLQHAHRQGVAVIPVPLPCCDRRSFVKHAGHLWELTRWLPGAAVYHQSPSRARLASAMHALAQFHIATSRFEGSQAGLIPSPAVQARKEQTDQLLQGGCDQIASSIRSGDWPELARRGFRLLELFRRHASHVVKQLESAASITVPLQPCIRDIWHDHVLFTNDVVTGIVDFGALRGETVAGDVARLLGSLAGDDAEAWKLGMAAYQARRPLSAGEQHLVRVLDQSTLLLSGLNWLNWVYIQQRQFDDRPKIIARLDATIARLE
jgi:Ser/Thr protein kinase RdoA (MazF antagonist)